MSSTAMAPVNPVRWYRSFYWRIGFSFLVFVIAVLIAQSAMFTYMMRRPPFTGRSPNNIAAIIAADLGSTLAQDRSLDLDEYLHREYGRLPPAYVVMKDGRVASNGSQPLAAELRRSVAGVLVGTDFRRTGSEPRLGGPPSVMAPIAVSGELVGMVVLPPPVSPGPIGREIGRILSIPGTAVLVALTAISALVIFAPARRRLKALEDVTRRLGSGELSARAPERGGDEIAHVAAAVNRMAAELAVRDQALRTSDRLRRQMLADVSHELKTPLTAMRGYVETLHMSDVDLDIETRQRYFATLARETVRLDRIVKDLLDLARLENGVVAFEPRLFAIGRVFAHVAERHEHEARSRGISIRSRVADAADQVWADPDRLEQVIENLVANALRHTPDGGSIELEAAVDAGAIVLSVVDSGEGIPADHTPYIFDRFYKADAARSNGSGGSGLGLSIAKAIVERHGGTIGVSSAPGRTVFTVTIPAADAGGTALPVR
jgi:two-component system OmpR family sensor kinase